jgi:hypothetical protein
MQPPRNILVDQLIQIATRNKNDFARYTIGNPGCAENEMDELLHESPADRYERCESFIRDHECDHFRMGEDMVYVGDEAFPDGYSHQQFIHETTKYDTRSNEYHIVTAKKAFKKVGL